MKEKKKQKFHVPDLKVKVRTLEAIFGEKFMRSKLNPRTIDKWLKEPDPTPYLTSLKKYFGVIGMKESDMIKSQNAFSKEAALIYARLNKSATVQYSTDDVISIYNRFLKGYRPETAMLGRTLEMIQKETIVSDYKYLKGYYHMYHYWKSGDAADRGKVRRNLLQVYDLDEHNGLMNCRLMISPMKDQEKDAWWIYEGWVVNIKTKLFWLFECVSGMPPEVVTFTVFKPSFWPVPDRFFLHGIVSALSLKGIPCASNMILVKIKSDDKLKNHIGYYSAEDIQAEGHQINIFDYIDNQTKPAHDILTVKSFA